MKQEQFEKELIEFFEKHLVGCSYSQLKVDERCTSIKMYSLIVKDSLDRPLKLEIREEDGFGSGISNLHLFSGNMSTITMPIAGYRLTDETIGKIKEMILNRLDELQEERDKQRVIEFNEKQTTNMEIINSVLSKV